MKAVPTSRLVRGVHVADDDDGDLCGTARRTMRHHRRVLAPRLTNNAFGTSLQLVAEPIAGMQLRRLPATR
jgi:hypothetical protein